QIPLAASPPNDATLSAAEISLVVEEFFSASVSPQRKSFLEQAMITFKTRNDSAIKCKQLLENHSSSYVYWFALSVLEDLTIRHFSPSESSQCLSFLWSLLINTHTNLEQFNLNKHIHMLVRISKSSSMNTNMLLQQLPILHATNPTLFFHVLKTLCEEYVSNREDISTLRRSELMAIVRGLAPEAMRLAAKFLGNVYLGLRTEIAKSPVNGTVFGISMDSPVTKAAGMVFPEIGVSPGARREFGVGVVVFGGSVGDAEKKGANFALEMVQVLFGCLLSSKSTWGDGGDSDALMEVLDVVFKFALLNDRESVGLGICALNCLNELLARNYLSLQINGFMSMVFGYSCTLLRWLTGEMEITSGRTLDSLDTE
ncbi:Exportin-6, partial [Nowakowskiella sp. JEL0078]